MPKPKSFQEKVEFSTRYNLRETILTTKYKGHLLIVTKDRYIAIQKKDKKKAKDFLNEIMSVLSLRCIIPYNVIREIDLDEVKFNKEETGESYNLDTINTSSPPSGRTLFHEKSIIYPFPLDRTSIN